MSCRLRGNIGFFEHGNCLKGKSVFRKMQA